MRVFDPMSGGSEGLDRTTEVDFTDQQVVGLVRRDDKCTDRRVSELTRELCDDANQPEIERPFDAQNAPAPFFLDFRWNERRLTNDGPFTGCPSHTRECALKGPERDGLRRRKATDRVPIRQHG